MKKRLTTVFLSCILCVSMIFPISAMELIEETNELVEEENEEIINEDDGFIIEGDYEEPIEESIVSGQCGDEMTWSYAARVLTISGSGVMRNYLWYKDIPWYEYHEDILSVVIEEGITAICDRAFWECENLTSVKIPNSLTTIPYGTFYKCSSLRTIKIPSSVTELGGDAFNKCSSLADIDLPEGLMTIKYHAFSGCSSLKEIYIPDSVETIEEFAFTKCSNLKKVVIPDNATVIDQGTFEGCTGLTSVIIPKGVTSIKASAFFKCSSLPSLKIPETVTFISDSAFGFCDNLKSITLNNVRLSADCQFPTANKYYDSLDNRVEVLKAGVLYNDTLVTKEPTPTLTPTPSPTKTPAPAVATYTVKYNGNGGTGTMNKSLFKVNIVAALSGNKFSKAGYVFTGWNTKKDGNGKSYKNKASVKDIAKKDQVLTLYAQWKPITYTVAFNANGGKGSAKSQKLTYGKKAKLKNNVYVKSGYKFKGWATSKGNAKKGKVKYKNQESVKNLTTKNSKVITLYAVWEKNKKK